MTDKADPVVELVEEEEEEWPEAGAQNVAEAEQYQDKINHIFDHLSILIHYIRTQKRLFQTPFKISKRSSLSNGTAWGQPTQTWY